MLRTKSSVQICRMLEFHKLHNKNFSYSNLVRGFIQFRGYVLFSQVCIYTVHIFNVLILFRHCLHVCVGDENLKFQVCTI